jgi:hypothetical protein
LPDHVLLHHFHLGLNKEAALHLDISSRGLFSHKTISEGKAILEKILEKTPYTGVFDEFPEEEEVKPNPDQQEEAHATESKILSNPSNDLVAEEPPTKGTHHTLEDDEPMFPFEIEEDLFEDFGNASNLPVQVKPLAHSVTSEDDDGPHNNSFLMEHIKGLSATMSREWLAKTELSTKVARIIAPSDVLTCIINKTTIEAHYSPTVGMNIISKALAETLCLNKSSIPSHKLLRIPSRVTLESYGAIRSIPLHIRGSEYRLDFHIYDISNMSLLIGVPLGMLFRERAKQGLLNLKLGSSPIVVSLARSNNTIVEPKPEQDPIEDVLMASLEDMAQPALDDELFIQEEEELAEPVELDQTELPS